MYGQMITSVMRHVGQKLDNENLMKRQSNVNNLTEQQKQEEMTEHRKENFYEQQKPINSLQAESEVSLGETYTVETARALKQRHMEERHSMEMSKELYKKYLKVEAPRVHSLQTQATEEKRLRMRIIQTERAKAELEEQLKNKDSEMVIMEEEMRVLLTGYQSLERETCSIQEIVKDKERELRELAWLVHTTEERLKEEINTKEKKISELEESLLTMKKEPGSQKGSATTRYQETVLLREEESTKDLLLKVGSKEQTIEPHKNIYVLDLKSYLVWNPERASLSIYQNKTDAPYWRNTVITRPAGVVTVECGRSCHGDNVPLCTASSLQPAYYSERIQKVTLSTESREISFTDWKEDQRVIMKGPTAVVVEQRGKRKQKKM